MSWLNLDPVFGYLAEVKLTEWNREAVAVSVVKAAERWALGPEGDESLHSIAEVELAGEEPFRHKIDVLATRKDNGQITIVDWKTKQAGALDDRWEMRETRSPQKKLYAAALAERYGNDIFPIRYEVRGIVLHEDKPKFKTLKFIINEGEAREAVRQIKDLAAMRDTLVDRVSEVWPCAPSGCRMFGDAYKCQFEPMCWEGVRKPESTERISRPFSHSKANEFIRCPERYRLIQITTPEEHVDDEENESTGPGTVFHKCMEMIYNQLRQAQLVATS